MTKLLLTLLLMGAFYGIATADRDPIKFGVINKSDLLNNVYAPDTSAAAVVLCDFGSDIYGPCCCNFRLRFRSIYCAPWFSQLVDVAGHFSARD